MSSYLKITYLTANLKRNFIFALNIFFSTYVIICYIQALANSLSLCLFVCFWSFCKSACLYVGLHFCRCYMDSVSLFLHVCMYVLYTLHMYVLYTLYIYIYCEESQKAYANSKSLKHQVLYMTVGQNDIVYIWNHSATILELSRNILETYENSISPFTHIRLSEHSLFWREAPLKPNTIPIEKRDIPHIRNFLYDDTESVVKVCVGL